MKRCLTSLIIRKMQINAYTDFITHQAPSGQVLTRDEGKFMKVTFGAPSVNHIVDIIKAVAA